jgi:hypothetical protein
VALARKLPRGTGGKRRHPRGSRIPVSERTSRKLDELLTQGVADGDARAELLKLAGRKIGAQYGRDTGRAIRAIDKPGAGD